MDYTLIASYDNKLEIHDVVPEYSIIVPVHNQELIVVENIQSVMMNTVGSYELIVIFDACEDQTEMLALTFFKSLKSSQRIICFRTDKSIFETSCDNIGFKMARGEFCVEIQADMKIMTYGYNFILSRPCRIWEDVFAVSGRCCHQWKDSSVGIGKLGLKVETTLSLTFNQMNDFYIAETCNRGPLLFVTKRLATLNYLDEKNFFLGDDDHDIMARAFDQFKWINGYMPIEFYSPIHLGSTRKPRTKVNQDRLHFRKSLSDGGYLGRRPDSTPRPLEVRKIEFNKKLIPTSNN